LTPAPISKNEGAEPHNNSNEGSNPHPSDLQHPDQPIGSKSEVETPPDQADAVYLLISGAEITEAIRAAEPLGHGHRDQGGSNPLRLQGFLWSQDESSILLVGKHSLTWFELASRHTRIVLSGEQELTDVSISPDGQRIGFVRDHSVYIVPSAGGEAKLISKAGSMDIREGEPDWSYRNEWHMMRAYWWSPDSAQIAYLEIDDRAVSKYSIRSSNGEAYEIPYPRPGGALPVVHLYVRLLSGDSPTEISLPPQEIPQPLPPNSTAETYKGSYIPVVAWSPDGHHLALERLDRRQQRLELLLADAPTGKVTSVLTETDKYWINVSGILHFLKDGKRFIWSSQRVGGYRHLYLYDLDGKEISTLTKGDWEVTGLNAVDESLGVAYFTGTEKSPLQRQLYRVNLDGSDFKQVTSEPGTHEAFFAPGSNAYLDIYSNVNTPPRSTLIRLQSSDGAAMAKKESKAAVVVGKTTRPESGAGGSTEPEFEFNLQPVEWIDVKLHQGLKTHAFMIRPNGFDATKKYPVIVYLAGGPGEQVVRDVWGGPTELWLQSMAQKGFIIFALDNQGTGGRGHYFEEPIHLRLGAQEMTDQRDGVRYLTSLPYVDPARIGVYGWGYGGYLAVHGMLDRPLIFKAGYAGAPITDWRFYDAIFGERYLDDSSVHADGWNASTALDNAKFLKGHLTIAQGTEDEFVHMENTLTLQHDLLTSGKAAEVLLLSGCGHEIKDVPARLVMFTNMTDFFVKNL